MGYEVTTFKNLIFSLYPRLILIIFNQSNNYYNLSFVLASFVADVLLAL
jgi:hypothetical protein